MGFVQCATSVKFQTAFDSNPNVEEIGVFLNISKAFDKVWHDGLLFKLESYEKPQKKKKKKKK